MFEVLLTRQKQEETQRGKKETSESPDNNSRREQMVKEMSFFRQKHADWA